jgi:hypothetical protein
MGPNEESAVGEGSVDIPILAFEDLPESCWHIYRNQGPGIPRLRENWPGQSRLGIKSPSSISLRRKFPGVILPAYRAYELSQLVKSLTRVADQSFS